MKNITVDSDMTGSCFDENDNKLNNQNKRARYNSNYGRSMTGSELGIMKMRSSFNKPQKLIDN